MEGTTWPSGLFQINQFSQSARGLGCNNEQDCGGVKGRSPEISKITIAANLNSYREHEVHQSPFIQGGTRITTPESTGIRPDGSNQT